MHTEQAQQVENEGTGDRGNAMSQTSLIDSVKKIGPSVVPILEKLPSGKSDFGICATGFFIHKDGLIATASHVTKTPGLHVTFENRFFPCAVVIPEFVVNYNANDPKCRGQHIWDIAILKIEGTESQILPARLSEKTSFELGEPAAVYGYYDRGGAYTLGNKTSIAGLLTSGIVSAAFPISSTDGIKLGSRLVLDITAGPGSSGSPAFDPESGEVIGIVSQSVF